MDSIYLMLLSFVLITSQFIITSKSLQLAATISCGITAIVCLGFTGEIFLGIIWIINFLIQALTYKRT